MSLRVRTWAPPGRSQLLLLAALLFVSRAGSANAADAEVLGVYPSAEQVPENLLRISIAFEAPPADTGLSELRLRSVNGRAIEGAFYPQPLWSPDGKTLTVYLDPGRVKSGLVAHDEGGRAIAARDTVQLWLGARMIKQWRIAPPLNSPLDLRDWRVQLPASGTRAPLRVVLPSAIDWQASSLLAVEAPDGTRLQGVASLSAGETAWTFVPGSTWKSGRYTLRAHPELEDPQGNRVGQAFEHKPARKDGTPMLRLPFTLPEHARSQ